MTEIKRNLALGTGIAALLGAGVYYYATRSPLPAPGGPTATSTPIVIDGIGASGNYTVERVEDAAPPPPAIRSIVITADLPAEARTAIAAHFAEYKTLLGKDPQNFNAWLDLAILYKIGGDYRGAEAIWLYTSKGWPGSPISFNNLADLYANFLKDKVKAEFYAKEAAKLQAAQS